jgi:hypothetical protein
MWILLLKFTSWIHIYARNIAIMETTILEALRTLHVLQRCIKASENQVYSYF